MQCHQVKYAALARRYFGNIKNTILQKCLRHDIFLQVEKYCLAGALIHFYFTYFIKILPLRGLTSTLCLDWWLAIIINRWFRQRLCKF